MHEDGDKWVVMEAIFGAFSMDVAVPGWAKEAYRELYNCTYGEQAKVGSWDEALQLKNSKKRRLREVQKKFKAIRIWCEIRRLHKEHHRAIDGILFDEVGKRYGVGKTVCSELYYLKDKEMNSSGVTTTSAKTSAFL